MGRWSGWYTLVGGLVVGGVGGIRWWVGCNVGCRWGGWYTLVGGLVVGGVGW